MDLSNSLLLAAVFAVVCTYYIGKKILTIDFYEYRPQNFKKAKLKRLLAKKDTPLQNSKIRRDIRNAFERILIPLGKANQDLLPARMDMAFRKKIGSIRISFAAKFTLQMLFPYLKMTLKHGTMTAENGGNRF